MARTWRFRQPLRDLLVVPREDAGPDERRKALPWPEARDCMRSVLREYGFGRGRLAAWMYEMAGRDAASLLPRGPDPSWLAERLDEAFLRGRLLVVPRALPTGAGITVREPAEFESPPVEEPVVENEKLTWIEIELLNTAGEPIPNERYILTLSDDTVKKGRLDKHGLARHDNIPDGPCKVTFPGFDGREWWPKT